MNKIAYITLLLFLTCKLRATDPQFTQFYSVPLYLSPSFAGATQQSRISSVFRQQWPSLPRGYTTYTFAYDQYFPNYKSGVGIMFLRDKAGTGNLGYTIGNLLYSYDVVFLNTWHFRPGVSILYKVFNLDFSKLHFFDQISSSDPKLPTTEQAPTPDIRGQLDGAFSTLIYNDLIWAGITVDHLLRPNQSFFGDRAPTPLKFSAYGGVKLLNKARLLKPLNESISLAYLYKYQGGYQQLDLGFYWLRLPLVFGLWYRGIPGLNSQYGDALSFLTGIKYNGMSFAYSYDFTVSNLINSTGGAHEVSLMYEFKTASKRRTHHAIPCPEF